MSYEKYRDFLKQEERKMPRLTVEQRVFGLY